MAPRSAGSNDRRHVELIVTTLLLFLVVRSLGSSPIGNCQSGRPSVLSFNIKENSWFWSESVMAGDDLEDLTSPGKMAYLNYTRAGNIANYLKLPEVDSIYLPVPVNFIFIGFDGKGNEEFKLHPEELEHWFTKMDHIFEHTRVPLLGDVLTPFYKTTVDKEQRHHLPIISRVNYNFSVHAIQMGETVSSVFERAINLLARKDDVSEPSFSVNAIQMGKKVSSVFERAIKVLAQKDNVSEPSFSVHAMQMGKKVSSVFERAIKVLAQKDNVSEPSFSVHAMQMGKKVLSVFERAINVLVQKDNVSESSFSNHAIQMGKKVSSVFERAINVLAQKDDVSDPRETNRALWQVDIDMFDSLFTSLVEYLQLENAYNVFILNPKHDKKIAKYGYRRGLSKTEIDFFKEKKSLQAKVLQTGGIPESILALDKIKRPLYEKHPMKKFAWTVTENTDTAEWYDICQDALDNVEKLYQGKDIADIIESKVMQDIKLLLDKELKSGDLSGLHSECLTDAWIGKDRWAFIDLSAGPFSWGPAAGGEGVRTEYTLPNVRRTIGAVAEEEAEDRLQDAIQEKFAVFGDAIDILLAEIDIYELFAFKHCKGRKVKLALCEELDQRMEDLKNELQEFEGEDKDESHQRKAIKALKRMESWNLFSDTHEDIQNYTVARDTFLAHLGATLWGSMRHIISPSMADGAFHYYEKISFQLFFITQEKVRHIKNLPVDRTALMDGLSSLLLPSQKPMFSQHMLPLSEDPALAMAFSVARRAAAVPYLLVNGTYRKSIRSYLDSSILQYQLQRLQDHGSIKALSNKSMCLQLSSYIEKGGGVCLESLLLTSYPGDDTSSCFYAGMHAHSRSTLEVPIFWFIHTDPLLVDKHYQAKALSDMVIVVQSESPSWESYLQCNGESLLWDLRRPVKAALSATAEHLAGLLPLHLVYSQVHETAVEDWVWSVGCNPFSVTSQGWHISRFHSDSIARRYIITALEESIQLVNSAIHLLVVERTTAKTYKIFQSQERKLVNKYNTLVGLWKRVSTSVGELRYADALRFLNTLEDASKGFAHQVNSTIALLHPVQCTQVRKLHAVFNVIMVLALLVVAGVLFIVLKMKRPKPKIKKIN